MGIVNKDLHFSQRRRVIEDPVGAVATGVTTLIGTVPSSGLIMSAYATAFGLSGTPTVSFSLYRIVSGGFTAVGLGATITYAAFGTSGVQSATLIGGVTALAGDLVVSLSGGANSAITAGTNAVVFQPQTDFLAFPGT